MAQKAQMNFKKGDDNIHYFRMSEAVFVPGGTLWFAAKPAVDNDGADSAAVINKSFTDANIVDNTHEQYVEGYATYELVFLPGDITSITYANGEKLKKYIGEFQLVSALNTVKSFPDDSNFIEVIIHADVKRGTS